MFLLLGSRMQVSVDTCVATLLGRFVRVCGEPLIGPRTIATTLRLREHALDQQLVGLYPTQSLLHDAQRLIAAIIVMATIAGASRPMGWRTGGVMSG